MSNKRYTHRRGVIQIANESVKHKLSHQIINIHQNATH